MDREQLTALRDVLNLILRLPDPVCGQLVQWLTPEIAKPNGHDPSPLVHAPPPGPAKVKAKTSFEAVHRAKLNDARTAEQRLVAAMRNNPNMTVIALANLIDASRSSTGERLRRLSETGAVEKDAAGRWRLKAGEAKEAEEAGKDVHPTIASPS